VVDPSISLTTIFKGVMVFLLADLVVILCLMSFPEIVLFLPRMME
jgi:TRAP-type mannitol/chloroaromatic compound transport system permease large subunit